jgi:hypothetical protein
MNRWDVANTAAAPAAQEVVATIDNIIDVTDGAGHGILVATDQIFVGGIEAGITLAGSSLMGARIMYRWKNVSLTEYIGIVQSQQ